MKTTLLWQKLKNLSLYDQRLINLQEKINETQTSLVHLDTQLTDIQHQLDEKHHEQRNLLAQSTTLEKKLNEYDTLIKQKKQRQTSVHSEREAAAVDKELVLLGDTLRAVEEEYFAALEKIDQLNEFFTHEEPIILKKREALWEGKRILTALMDTHKQEYEQTKQEHTAIIESITDDWVHHYQAMKKRVNDPLVPLIDQACSACFYSILTQDAMRLKQGALLNCRNCYRLLYYQDDSLQESSAT